MMSVKNIAIKAKEASEVLRNISTSEKNKALLEMANSIKQNINKIIKENKKDIKNAKNKNLSKALIDRLFLNNKRIQSIVNGLYELINLNDPIGQVIREIRRPNGLLIKKVRVPLGVVGIIYESRPNVTADATGLCIKSGNSVVLKGGSEAIFSNKAIINALKQGLKKTNIPQDSIGFIPSIERKVVNEMVKLDKFIDVIIPRGGEKMINKIRKLATIPVIAHGKGLCHIYVHKDANLSMALNIVYNAKVQRPGVCNAVETVLIHKDISNLFLPIMVESLKKANVVIKGDEKTTKIVPNVKKATSKDWETEYLDLVLSVKVVNSLAEAITHINRYGSAHSEAIITQDKNVAERFLKEVDASSVYWNASTRFTDGNQFGMGAEIGISTQKLHARGPMGLEELTSVKFMVYGSGQIRN